MPLSTAQPVFLVPDWPAPAVVRAAFALRSGGVSAAPWASLNLGGLVGDDPAAVGENRRRLCAALALPAEPRWLEQVHGTVVHGDRDADEAAARAAGEGLVAAPPVADAALTHRAGTVLAIMVADCLPVLFCDRAGTVVGAAHAGWRGLAAGVLENTVAALGVAPSRLLAWLGPAIGPTHFEVGPEVREQFILGAPAAAAEIEARFVPHRADRWLCDLPGLARDRLMRLGIASVTGGEACTASDPQRFFSHRRDAPRTGRMAALIWLQPRQA